jgi:hypothetical protein
LFITSIRDWSNEMQIHSADTTVIPTALTFW